MTTAVLSPASAAPAPTRKRRRVLPGFQNSYHDFFAGTEPS